MSTYSKFTLLEQRQFMGEYLRGATVRDLAAKAGVTGGGMWRLLQRNGCPRRSTAETCALRPRPVTPVKSKAPRPIRRPAIPTPQPILQVDRPVQPTIIQPNLPIALQFHDLPQLYTTAGQTAVYIADPQQWHVRAIQDRFGYTHAVARLHLSQIPARLELLGYRPLLLWTDEQHSPALQRMLGHRAGSNERTASARDCVVRPVDRPDAHAFYEAHHLQGSCNAKWSYGLYLADQLVACMSFNSSTACRGMSHHQLLQRFAVVGSVPGAASRLLTAFRREHAGPVVSYSDDRYAPGGKLYATLGFTLQSQGKPDYRYWRMGRWWAKNTKQRRQLIAELTTRNEPLLADDTEYTMADRLGYLRVYDCGKKTWILN